MHVHGIASQRPGEVFKQHYPFLTDNSGPKRLLLAYTTGGQTKVNFKLFFLPFITHILANVLSP